MHFPGGQTWSRVPSIIGWVGTGPTPIKREHLSHNRNVSVSYWSTNHDTCQAECEAEWAFDEFTRTRVWEMFKQAPEPLGYDPAIIPAWDSPTSAAEPWRIVWASSDPTPRARPSMSAKAR